VYKIQTVQNEDSIDRTGQTI